VLTGVLLSGIFFASKVQRMFAIEREPSAEDSATTGAIDVSRAHFWDISPVDALDKIVARLHRDRRQVEVIGYDEASADIVDRFALQDMVGFELGAVPH
jgi:sulfate permease, SulP family